MKKTVKQSVPHRRGENADHHLSDVVLLTLVGMMGGATSMAKVTTVWADSVLRKVAGWIKIPVETTILRIFKEVSDRQISQFETLTHTLRGQHWRRLLRSGKSKTGIQSVQWVDVDSTVDTVCGRQEGSAKGFNPKKKGARSYHPQRIRLDCDREASHNLNRLLDKPGTIVGIHLMRSMKIAFC